MRRLCLYLLVSALTVPTLAVAAGAAQSDGTLVVSKANGTILVRGKGLIYGHLTQGKLTVVDYKPDKVTVPSVSGAKFVLAPGSLDVVYTGTDIRFLFPSGKYTLRLEGSGIDISAVGKGSVQAIGSGSPDDGSFTINGGKAVPIGFRAAASFNGNESARGRSSEKGVGGDDGSSQRDGGSSQREGGKSSESGKSS
jgi:hypothetical protein